MTILNKNPILTSFDVADPNLKERFLTIAKWGYTLFPKHPTRKNIFKSVISVLFDNDENSENISFSGGIVIRFDTNNKMPTLDELYELAEVSRIEVNTLFQTELLIQASNLTLELPPIDKQSTVDNLKRILNTAYPRLSVVCNYGGE